jgi:hypothetical protein
MKRPVGLLTMTSRSSFFWTILGTFCLLGSSLYAQLSQPDLSGLSSDDRTSIEAACSTAKYLNEPASYHQCLQQKLRELSGSKSPDVSGLSSDDRTSIEAACSTAKYLNGPASYHQCLQQKLRELSGSKSPDVSGLSSDDRTSIEAACSTSKYLNGPASYHQCLQQQLRELSGSKAPGLSSENQVSQSGVTQTTHPLPVSGTGLCAENGSCYGDPNVNGVPKTVHVNGYYRKDGTYVRGHYRSAPGTNPPKH